MRCRCGKQMKAGFRGWECGCGAIKPYLRKAMDETERKARRGRFRFGQKEE